MARLGRIVVPGLPHHVTQRGNGRDKVFFTSDDYALYKSLLVKHCRAANVGTWAWCLMPNQIAVTEHSLSGEQDRRTNAVPSPPPQNL